MKSFSTLKYSISQRPGKKLSIFTRSLTGGCSSPEFDAIIVGGGHNGLTTAAYLGKAGKKVLVLERRSMVGGAAVTEELYAGFKFSRASYLAGLLRPSIISDLELKKHGLKFLLRDPSSFTPSTLEDPIMRGKSLLLGMDEDENRLQIAQFSEADALAFSAYESFLNEVRDLVWPLLDEALPQNPLNAELSFAERVAEVSKATRLLRLGFHKKQTLVPFYELFTGPASFILDRWFESDVLKATLATDAVIGALTSPSQPGSAYVLLHHVMGSVDGRQGVWAYVEGGMGQVSEALRASAESYGVEIRTETEVDEILLDPVNDLINPVGEVENSESEREFPLKRLRARGVKVQGKELTSRVVVAGCSPYHAFLDLLRPKTVPVFLQTFQERLKKQDLLCGAFKINLAVSELPNFACLPNAPLRDSICPQHRGTIHFETTVAEIEDAFREAAQGIPATKPVVEMTIPSALDTTIAPPGQHVVQLFVQFAPFDVNPEINPKGWQDLEFKESFVERVLDIVEQHCPGFKQSILFKDALSPLDLETIFKLPRGNIFHASLSLHQLGFARPAPNFANHASPVDDLYMASAGCHPGGGVMGAPGRNCAKVLLKRL